MPIFKNSKKAKAIKAAKKETIVKVEQTVHEFNQKQPDRLLDNASVKLTHEQEDFLSLYIDLGRNELYKTFKKRFNSSINKFQFNFALGELRETLSKEVVKVKVDRGRYPRPDVEKMRNVYWISDQGLWHVKFKINGKANSLGRYIDHVKAVQVADEYRQNLA